MSKRTIIQFNCDGDIWSIVDKWASEHGYRQKESSGAERTYQKGVGFLVAPMMLKIKSNNSDTTLEAWIRANLFVRLMSLFILPSEMGIESGGFKAVVPRSIARKAVNKLLNQLEQTPIS